MTTTNDFLGVSSVPDYVPLQTYALNARVLCPQSNHFYRKKTAAAGSALYPSENNTDWALIGAGGIKSVAVYQDAIGGGSTTKVTTITAVSDKAVVIHGGYNSGFLYAVGDGTGCYITKTSSTQVTASRVNTNAPCYYAFTVVDYW